jgi:uncharacterized membrane protein YhiD involved in acid resistance
MNELFSDFLVQDSVQIPLLGHIINMLITAALSFILSMVYGRFGRSLSNRSSFAANFVLIAVTTMVIITIVKSSMALSLGLVGALSIVRFRAAIKEPEELAYLFLNIAIGLGMGANQKEVTVSSFAIICVLIVIGNLKYFKKENENLLINIRLNNPSEDDSSNLITILTKHCSSVKLKRIDLSDSSLDSAFIVNVKSIAELNSCQKELRSLGEDVKISYMENKSIAY